MSSTPAFDRLGPTTRFAIRIYPGWWRVLYEAEVVDTLLEVRDRRRGNVLDDLDLARRGAWLRARTSPAFWGGLFLLGVMLWASTQGSALFLAERYWPALLTEGGSSAPLALPVAAAIAALQGHRHRARAVSGSGPAKRAVVAALAMTPVLATLLSGYLLIVLLSVFVSGLPAAASPSALLVPVSFAALSLGAVAVGFVLGNVLPRVLSVPLAGVLLYAWYSMPESFGGSVLAWRNLTGAGLMHCCLWVDVVPHPQAQLIVIVSGASVVGITLMLFALRPGVLRSVLTATAALSIVVVLISVAPAVPKLGETGYVGRALTDLRCEGARPQVCLWPEQEMEFGNAIRPVVSEAFRRGMAEGLPMRLAVTPSVSGLSAGQSVGSPINEVSMRLGDSDAQILASYGHAVYASESCAANHTIGSSEFGRELGVQYAIALLLGAEPVGALPHIEHSAEARLPSIAYTPEEVRDLIGVHDIGDARTAVSRWLASCGN